MRVEWMWLVIVIILIRCNADEGGDAKISPKWLRGETPDSDTKSHSSWWLVPFRSCLGALHTACSRDVGGLARSYGCPVS